MTGRRRSPLTAPAAIIAGPLKGPETPGQRYVRALQDDHAAYSRILSLVSSEIEQLPHRPRRVLRLLAEAFDYIADTLDALHHEREDVLFEFLARRSRQSSRMLSQLRDQHDRDERAGSSIREEIAALMRSAQTARLVTLAKAIDAFVEGTREHIGLEERLLYSRAMRALGPADWTAITRAASRAGAGRRRGTRSAGGHRSSPLGQERYTTGHRHIRGEAGSAATRLGMDTAGLICGDLAGRAFGTVMLARSQAREAFTLAIDGTRSLLAARSLAAYPAVVRDVLSKGVQAAARWSDSWQTYAAGSFQIARSAVMVRPARGRRD